MATKIPNSGSRNDREQILRQYNAFCIPHPTWCSCCATRSVELLYNNKGLQINELRLIHFLKKPQASPKHGEIQTRTIGEILFSDTRARANSKYSLACSQINIKHHTHKEEIPSSSVLFTQHTMFSFQQQWKWQGALKDKA